MVEEYGNVVRLSSLVIFFQTSLVGAFVDGAPNIINCMTHRMDAFVAPEAIQSS